MRLSTCFLLFALATTPLSARTILITGANRGLGLEFARQYSEKGYKVIGTARDPESATELKQLSVRVEELDVANPSSIEALAQRLADEPIDVLINNAGIMRGRHSGLQEVTSSEMELSFAVNSTGPLLVTQKLLPNLRKGQVKKIIGISSQLGSIENNTGGMYAYRASKAALNQINKSMSVELGKEGFTCVVLHPGWVQTDMGGDAATYTPVESVQSMIQVIDGLSSQANGHFFTLEGQELPW